MKNEQNVLSMDFLINHMIQFKRQCRHLSRPRMIVVFQPASRAPVFRFSPCYSGSTTHYEVPMMPQKRLKRPIYRMANPGKKWNTPFPKSFCLRYDVPDPYDTVARRHSWTMTLISSEAPFTMQQATQSVATADRSLKRAIELCS